MAITTTTNKVQYTSLSGSTYPITFPYFAKSEINAVLSTPTGDVVLALTTNFTLTDPADSGTLTKVGSWDATATRLTIYRDVPLTQPTDLANGDTLDANVLETMHDRIVAIAQQLKESQDRNVSVPISDASANLELPNSTDRASRFLGFDSGGEAIAVDGTVAMSDSEILEAVKRVDGTGSGLDADHVQGEDIFAALAKNIAFASGYGIDFSATSDGSGTATSEILDDYEEGTWTPTLIGSSTAGAQTYSYQNGKYVKIGSTVFIECYVTITAKDGAMAGSTRIGGLPYTVSSSASIYGAMALTQYQGITMTAGHSQLTVTGIISSTQLGLIENGSATTPANITVANTASSTNVVCSGTYLV